MESQRENEAGERKASKYARDAPWFRREQD